MLTLDKTGDFSYEGETRAGSQTQPWRGGNEKSPMPDVKLHEEDVLCQLDHGGLLGP